MGALTNGLVQMNAKMVVTKDAIECIVLGLLAFVVMAIWTGWMVREKKWSLAVVMGVIMLACGAFAIHGATMPRVKEIRACAVEPVELDSIAAVYDIVSVDGKELVLRERG